MNFAASVLNGVTKVFRLEHTLDFLIIFQIWIGNKKQKFHVLLVEYMF